MYGDGARSRPCWSRADWRSVRVRRIDPTSAGSLSPVITWVILTGPPTKRTLPQQGERNQRMTRRNSVNWQGDESMSAIRAGQGILVGLLRCGHCGRKLHVRYWGVRGTHARYLCKGDYDDGGQYCLGFGGASVDRRLGQELLGVISPFGVEASLRALEGLSAGDAAQRATLSSKLEQLEYEAKKAFEQYDVVDARNRLAAGELERRWNEKLEEIATVKQRLSSLHEKC